jgi:hypothetical protein
VFHRVSRLALASIGVAALALAIPVGALAHTVKHAGSYTLEIGWKTEPTYVASPNAVSVTITDAAGKPVNDLGADDLNVVVSTANQPSPELSFEPGFDPEEMEGPLGEYDAAIVPTAPGDYTFRITGTVHGTNVDITVTSGDETFNAVVESTNLQFPAKLPSVAEVATHLDRIDARIEALPTAGPSSGLSDALAAATTAASDAKAAANQALLVGGGLAVIGILLGLAGIVMARRAASGRSR